jgi:hypothetical protein
MPAVDRRARRRRRPFFLLVILLATTTAVNTDAYDGVVGWRGVHAGALSTSGPLFRSQRQKRGHLLLESTAPLVVSGATVSTDRSVTSSQCCGITLGRMTPCLRADVSRREFRCRTTTQYIFCCADHLANGDHDRADVMLTALI